MGSIRSILGVSAAIRTIEEEIEYAARSTAKVLISGESGVGKEMVARIIHHRSTRRDAPLVPINCAGIPDSLLESELFGHVKGSFTDAYRDKRGWLADAHGGTVFLDEIGEMSLRMQALLLRFLETGEVQRVGSDRPSPCVDVRIIAATHRHLIDLVAAGKFREDLYYRLNVMHIEVPPLRERREDIVILLSSFLQAFADLHHTPRLQIEEDALHVLTEYAWPGNVRELRNLTERLALLRSDGRVAVDALPEEIRSAVARQKALEALDAASVPSAQQLFDCITRQGASFWSAAYEPFMARDLTRREIREVVRLGLEETRGNYKMLVKTFNMQPAEYKKFLNFLRKYQCHVPFQAFRMAQAALGKPRTYIASA